jgi:galactokinase/mevalonate kinase-like predicted kinase
LTTTLEASAPARANLIGNPSDQYGGATLACALPLRARVRLAAGDSGEGCVVEAEGDRARLRDAADLALRDDRFDWVRAVLAARGAPPPPLRLVFETEIPRQSGIAGSTALVVALVRLLAAWDGERLHPWALAERARDVELRHLGVQCGFVDQYTCAFGGLRYVDLRGKGLDPDPEKAPLATVEDLAPWVPRLPFLLAFTGRSHASDSVHRPLRERWLAGEPEVVRAYERIGAIAGEGKRALLAADWATLGALMNENHALQRDLGGSGEPNERLIEAALAAGATAAKLAGAGDGGTIVALWPHDDALPLEQALREAGAAALWRPEAGEPGAVERSDGHASARA